MNVLVFEGIEMENGFLVKYYADNNFYGQKTKTGRLAPQFTEIKPELSFGK